MILVDTSGGASKPILVGHKCVTGGAQAIKLGHTYIDEVGHRPHLAPPSRRLWLILIPDKANTFRRSPGVRTNESLLYM